MEDKHVALAEFNQLFGIQVSTFHCIIKTVACMKFFDMFKSELLSRMNWSVPTMLCLMVMEEQMLPSTLPHTFMFF